jgi:succinate dehydrogenase/fumarate reductase flavoprotein subunit
VETNHHLSIDSIFHYPGTQAPFPMLQAYRNKKNKRSDNIVDKARQELSEIEKELENSNMKRGQSDEAREFQDVHDLIALVKAASSMGNIRILRRRSTSRV